MKKTYPKNNCVWSIGVSRGWFTFSVRGRKQDGSAAIAEVELLRNVALMHVVLVVVATAATVAAPAGDGLVLMPLLLELFARSPIFTFLFIPPNANATFLYFKWILFIFLPLIPYKFIIFLFRLWLCFRQPFFHCLWVERRVECCVVLFTLKRKMKSKNENKNNENQKKMLKYSFQNKNVCSLNANKQTHNMFFLPTTFS